MAKLLYSLLLIGGATGVGLAIIKGWFNYKLYQLDREAERPAFGLLLVGMIVQNGVLTYALIDIGTTQPSGRAWFYATGLVVTTAALAWLCLVAIADLAVKENYTDGQPERSLEQAHRDEATKHVGKEV